MIRFLFYLILFYFLWKWLKRLSGVGGRKRSAVLGNNKAAQPPPFDPNNVEDIDYKEL